MERASSRTPSLSSRLAMVLEIAGWPIFRSRAASENDPASTTRTNISISRRRLINRGEAVPYWNGFIPDRNRCYHRKRPTAGELECLESSLQVAAAWSSAKRTTAVPPQEEALMYLLALRRGARGPARLGGEGGVCYGQAERQGRVSYGCFEGSRRFDCGTSCGRGCIDRKSVV